jgi:ribosomal protein S12 methylthiotransferase accessory factor
MSGLKKPIPYRLDLGETADSTGYFKAIPEGTPSFSDCLDYLCQHPHDGFMQAHLLEHLGAMDMAAVNDLLRSETGRDPVVQALLLEAGTVYGHLAAIRKRFTAREAKRLAGRSPLIFLRSAMLPDQALHRQWARLFQANLMRHRPLPPPQKTGLSVPVEGVTKVEAPLPDEAHLKAVIDRCRPDLRATAASRPPLSATIDRALERLGGLDIFEGAEMRHQSSLSLYALLRKWRFHHHVTTGALDYTLSSTQTSYGRGLTLEAARASCLMEVAERCSSFAGIDQAGVVGTKRQHPLMHGSRSALSDRGFELLDPNLLGLEVPYRDEPLYWIEGRQLTADGFATVWVPVQCVFLFCNLDERSLFSGLGSTGLASGNTPTEAKLSALYELIERDCQAVNPFHPSRCFRVVAQDERMNALFEDYRARGIHVQFQDISPAFGIPCCTCFVTHRDGTVAKGGGANLNGKRAVLSALTETPYPYPIGPPSAPPLPDLPVLPFENLPDFSTGSPDHDLLLVEKTLSANGYAPIYVDITRKDLDIPVVKALVPGFELIADFDQFCRINPRLFNNYLKIHEKR